MDANFKQLHVENGVCAPRPQHLPPAGEGRGEGEKNDIQENSKQVLKSILVYYVDIKDHYVVFLLR